MKHYAVTYTYGERTLIDATRPSHRDYMTQLKEAGTVIAAGPFAGDEQSMIIFRVSDEAELERILADDPYAAADALDGVTVREWNPLISVF